jgi:hypothetical protein
LIPASLVLAFLPILLIQHYSNPENKLVQTELAEGFHCQKQLSLKGQETIEFYVAKKKNEMLTFTGKWIELENIILSEVSLAQKTKNHMFSLICGH